MSKWTPGPWERVDTADYAEIHPRGQRLPSPIALVGKEGDADLIFLAPEMAEALKVVAKAEIYDPATGIIDADVLEIVQEQAHAILAKLENNE